MPVDAAHNVGRLPSSAGKDVGLRDPALMAVGHEEVAEVVEPVFREQVLPAEIDIGIREAVNCELREIPLPADLIGQVGRDPDETVRCVSLRDVIDGKEAVLIHDHGLVDMKHVLPVEVVEGESADLTAPHAKEAELERNFEFVAVQEAEHHLNFTLRRDLPVNKLLRGHDRLRGGSIKIGRAHV